MRITSGDCHKASVWAARVLRLVSMANSRTDQWLRCVYNSCRCIARAYNTDQPWLVYAGCPQKKRRSRIVAAQKRVVKKIVAAASVMDAGSWLAMRSELYLVI